MNLPTNADPHLELILEQQRAGDLPGAEALLSRWIAQRVSTSFAEISGLRLVPKPTSLNSINGHFFCAGKKYFYKAHIEEQGAFAEYQNAQILRSAGYPVLEPVAAFAESSHRLLIYPFVDLQSLFDLVGELERGTQRSISLEEFLDTERREAEQVYHIYTQTLAPLSAEENTQALIHSLFWHRLTGERLQSFYRYHPINLPIGNQIVSLEWETLLRLKWVINGRTYQQTLGDMLDTATQTLAPACPTISILGHGDAHYGNVFWEPVAGKTEKPGYRYFDPAFAGRHSPLLDLVKPLFHNVFARWMYFPEEIAANLAIQAALHGETLTVEHSYVPSQVRQEMLKIKRDHLLLPLVQELKQRGALPANWQEILRSALLCCPLLTVNLANPAQMPRSVALLGFAYTVEMGGTPAQGEPALLDAALAD